MHWISQTASCHASRLGTSNLDFYHSCPTQPRRLRQLLLECYVRHFRQSHLQIQTSFRSCILQRFNYAAKKLLRKREIFAKYSVSYVERSIMWSKKQSRKPQCLQVLAHSSSLWQKSQMY